MMSKYGIIMQDPDTSKEYNLVILLPVLKDLILVISESSRHHYQEKVTIRKQMR